jgi:DNA processing protein
MVKNPLTCRARRETVERLRDSVIALSDDDYPPLLKQIPDPPLVLHFRGRKELLTRPAIAIVGSRTASPYGVNAAQELTRRIVESGLAVVSGMARGIDCAAHTTTLETGGSTIGVLGTGIDIAYPRDNKPLYRRMCTEGLLLTEFRPGVPPLKMNFPIRNRIISGLTLGTVIVEATGRSGSLVTARMALEQNREVFAVPGSIFSPGSEGPHRLVQYGAKLVHDVADILQELPFELGLQVPAATAPPPLPDEPLRGVLEALSRDEGRHIDHLAENVGSSTSALAELLLELELAGWIRALPGARWVRVR